MSITTRGKKHFSLRKRCSQNLRTNATGSGRLFITSVSADVALSNRGDILQSKAASAMRRDCLQLDLQMTTYRFFDVHPDHFLAMTDSGFSINMIPYGRKVLVPARRWGHTSIWQHRPPLVPAPPFSTGAVILWMVACLHIGLNVDDK